VRNNIPVHSTGAAVDIRLWDNHHKQFVDLGPFGVIWGKNTTAPTFSEDISDAQKNNRLYALVAATQAGLINYVYEYWHFSSGDRYASFWQEPDPTQRKAMYNTIQHQ
jgi:zinc D-Ala-D-Ala dipeptidase